MLRILIPLCSFFVIAQQPVFDGVVSAKEWQDAQQFSIPYEIEPSDNGPAHYKTEVYVCHIARLITNYQFNKDLSFRLVGEYNEFDDTLFVQPLLKWKRNKKPLHKSEGVRRRRRHTLPPVAVPSALLGLTSLFGMGRGEPQCNNHLIVVRDLGVGQDFESQRCHWGHRLRNTIILRNIYKNMQVVTTYKKETVTVGLWVISITRL